jgi:hypothetical protein
MSLEYLKGRLEQKGFFPVVNEIGKREKVANWMHLELGKKVRVVKKLVYEDSEYLAYELHILAHSGYTQEFDDLYAIFGEDETGYWLEFLQHTTPRSNATIRAGLGFDKSIAEEKTFPNRVAIRLQGDIICTKHERNSLDVVWEYNRNIITHAKATGRLPATITSNDVPLLQDWADEMIEKLYEVALLDGTADKFRIDRHYLSIPHSFIITENSTYVMEDTDEAEISHEEHGKLRFSLEKGYYVFTKVAENRR